MNDAEHALTLALPSQVVGTNIQQIGHLADEYARSHTFRDYQERKTANTKRRQLADLGLFSTYLGLAGVARSAQALFEDPHAWAGVTFGLVEGFIKWQLQQGYAIGSINVRLSTIRRYCHFAHKAGVLDSTVFALIKAVEGYKHKEGRNIDQTRPHTRTGAKKATPVSLNVGHALKLKRHPNTAKGRRDALLMCLLLDHGLRCSEIAGLQLSQVDREQGLLTFYREKVDLVQTHRLTGDTMVALMDYLDRPRQEIDLAGPLFYGQQGKWLSTRAINDRVGRLGALVGLIGLSPHDCRHYWATIASRNNTPIKNLQDAGGWSSPAMPLRYAESAKIANEGVNLG